MDAIVEGLLIVGLHNLDDDGLPMQTNEFYSKVVLACKPAGVELMLLMVLLLLLCECPAVVPLASGQQTQVQIHCCEEVLLSIVRLSLTIH